jgi:hypothetical protein
MAGTLEIREHMTVYGSCGNRIGTVDGMRGELLWLVSDPKEPDDTYCVPLDWVDSVERDVRLTLPCEEIVKKWQSAAAIGW